MQRREAAGGAVELAAAKAGQGVVVLALLLGIDRELAAVDRHLLRLDLAHPVVDALLDVDLLALQLGDVARQLLDLAAQPGVVGALRLDLRVQVEQAALELADAGRPSAPSARPGARAPARCSARAAGAGRGSRGAPRRRRRCRAWAGRRERERQASEAARARAARHDLRASSSLRRPSARRGGSSPTLPRRSPCTAGRSLPKLDGLELRVGCTPSSVSDLTTASARRWPSARLYSLLPRSSVWPSTAILRLGSVASTLALRLDHRAELVLDDVAVEVEVDDARKVAHAGHVAAGGRRRGATGVCELAAASRAAFWLPARPPRRCATRPAPASSSLTLEQADERRGGEPGRGVMRGMDFMAFFLLRVLKCALLERPPSSIARRGPTPARADRPSPTAGEP